MTNTMAGRKTIVLGMMLLFAMPLWAQEGAQDAAGAEEGLVPPAPSGRTVYRSVDSQGNVIFTDHAPTGRASEQVRLPHTNAIPAHVPIDRGGPLNDESSAYQYERFDISSPQQDEFFGQDVETVDVNILMLPGLQQGHRLQLFLNGQPVGEGGTSYTMEAPLERGTYTATAVIYDADGNVLQEAKPVQFHVRRISLLDGETGQPKEETPKDPTLLPGAAPGINTGAQGANSAGGAQTSGKPGGTAGSAGGIKKSGTGAGSASGVGGKR